MAAFLILAAIVGFAGGAYLGTQSDNQGAQAAPPGQTDPTSTDDPGGNDDGGSETDPDVSETPDEETASPGDVGISFTIEESSVAPNQRINYSGTVSPPEEGVTLRIERSIDGGEWAPFPEDSPITRDTNADGSFSGYVQTGRSGENAFRMVRVDDESVVSDPAVVTVE